LADPSGLDGGGQGAQVRPGGQVGEIVFLLSRRPMFADEPGFVPRQMLLTLVSYALRRPVSDTDTDSTKAAFELTFRTGSPVDGPPAGIGQHVFGRYREDIRDVPPTGTAASGCWPDQPHADRVHLEMTRNANGPG